MNPVIISLLAIVGLALVGVGGDTLLRLAGAGVKFIDWKFFILGLIVYASTAIGWFFALKYIKFSTVGVYYSLASLLFLIIIGHFYFKETLSPREIFGMVLGVASIILLRNI
jgi:undecaprenyl phosphate-alpha-L-ara4N flippase subunit ArnF